MNIKRVLEVLFHLVIIGACAYLYVDNVRQKLRRWLTLSETKFN